MDLSNNWAWKQETWLQQDGKFRRPLARKALSKDEFESQKRDDVEYAIFQRITGTYSDGKGGRGLWKRV